MDKEKFEIAIIEGVEGNCILLNNFRVVGPKPWGGGRVIEKWQVSLEDIEQALNKKFK